LDVQSSGTISYEAPTLMGPWNIEKPTAVDCWENEPSNRRNEPFNMSISGKDIGVTSVAEKNVPSHMNQSRLQVAITAEARMQHPPKGILIQQMLDGCHFSPVCFRLFCYKR